jgi:DNA ligase-1
MSKGKEFAPMLAGKCELAKLKFPVIVSPKLDGIRCLCRGGRAVSRQLIDIPNEMVQSILSDHKYDGLDGELIVGSPTDPDVYRKTNSGVMSEKTTPDFKYYVFDVTFNLACDGFESRFKMLQSYANLDRVVIVPQYVVRNIEELITIEEKFLREDYEGVMLRSPQGPYKYGRSTTNEGYLLKLKRFVDGEFKIVGFEERMENKNEATVDNLGHTKRSTHKANKVGRGDLGALVLEFEPGVTFNCGSGFNDEERLRIWNNRESYFGMWATIKYFVIGMKDLPRFPTFKGIRHD